MALKSTRAMARKPIWKLSGSMAPARNIGAHSLRWQSWPGNGKGAYEYLGQSRFPIFVMRPFLILFRRYLEAGCQLASFCRFPAWRDSS